MTRAEQELIEKTKKAEKDFWQPTHNKQKCHDLAKECEETIRKNAKKEQKR